MSRWRLRADAVIEAVIRANPGADENLLRKKLSEAYPFGERKHHPYKIWLSAVSNALKPATCQKKYLPPPDDIPGQLLLV